MLNSTARNLNTRLFRASASFDNKIKTKGLILPSCEDQITLNKEFTDMPIVPQLSKCLKFETVWGVLN